MVTNTLAYCGAELIVALECFIYITLRVGSKDSLQIL
jgi:hypothetical protein